MSTSPGSLAEMHARCFTNPRAWTAREFRDLLSHAGHFLLARDHGFLLGRVTLDEAELLTLAVGPEARRRGIGLSLVEEFATTARDMGARVAFLEVAHDNRAALALYHRAHWIEAGNRRNYFGPGQHAIVMEKTL